MKWKMSFAWAWDKAKATPLYSRPRGWTDGRIDLEATPIDLKPGDATPPIRYGMSVPLLEQQFVIDTAFEGARGMATLQHRILEGRVRYDHSEKEFYYWNGHAYTKDRTRLMSDAVLYTQAQYRHHAATLEGEAQQAEAAAKEKLDAAITPDRRKSPRKNARLSIATVSVKYGHAKALRNVVRRLNEREGVRSTLGFISEMPTVALSGDKVGQVPVSTGRSERCYQSNGWYAT